LPKFPTTLLGGWKAWRPERYLSAPELQFFSQPIGLPAFQLPGFSNLGIQIALIIHDV
jgi:hypothetical protein